VGRNPRVGLKDWGTKRKCSACKTGKEVAFRGEKKKNNGKTGTRPQNRLNREKK